MSSSRPRPLARALVTATVAVLCLFGATAIPAQASGLLLPRVAMQTAADPAAHYRGQLSCDPVAKPGLLALRDMVLGYYGIGRSGGITRSCSIGGASEHKEGRAWDWMVDADDPRERAAADDFVLWLTGPDRNGEVAGNARRLGVMYVIWNRQMWSAYNAAAGWTPYRGASPHTDHVHVSLSWDGAFQRTSWWTGVRIEQQDVGPCRVYVGEPAPAYTGPRYTACPPAVPRPVNLAASASPDLDGDGVPDTLGRERAAGSLWFYAGAPGGVPVSRRVAGSGWQMHDGLVLTPDVTGDGRADLWARDSAQGRLWVYPGDGAGSFTPATTVGSGWHMHDALLAAGDVTGDGHPDLWARERATGVLWLYPGSAGGVPTAPRAVGTGWGMHDFLVSPGDVTGDGVPDLWAREAGAGILWLYTGDGQGGFVARRATGSGWGMHDVLTPTADVTGDGRPDLFARERSTGTRWLYPTDSAGSPLPASVVGWGWGMHDVVL